MNRPGLVSGVVIFLNAGRFLAEAIESARRQTYREWELLLVDDGSADESSDVARDYAARFPGMIRCLEHPGRANLGMSASRNLGIREARGEFVGFLDADDVWLPEKLEQQVGYLGRRSEALMVYGRTEIWHSWTGADADAGRDYLLELGVAPGGVIAPPELLLLLLENRTQTPTTCNALIRREAFERLGMFEERFRGMFEDLTFFAKICAREPVFVADEIWARYRQHPGSCCAKADRSGETKRTRRLFLLWLREYLRREGIRDERIWRVLRRELWPLQHPRLHEFRQRFYRFRRAWGWRAAGEGKGC